MNNKNISHMVAFVGLIALYAVGYSLDRLSQYNHEFLSANFAYPNPLFALWTVANIILAIGVFSLFILAMPKLAPWTLWIILVLGLAVNIIPVLVPLPLRYIMFIVDRSYFVSVGGWTAVAAIFTLFRKKENEKGRGFATALPSE